MNSSILYIAYGIPSKPDEYRLVFSYVELADDTATDGQSYKFRELFEMAISCNNTVAQLKEIVCKRVNEEIEDLTLDPANIRLREKSSDRLTKTLFDDQIVKS
jgi:hypothetical protein